MKSRRLARIVIALDPSAPSYTVQRLVKELAAGERYELLGVFIEDSRVLEHARSSLATEVILSGTSRALTVSTLERQIRVSSEHVRRQFETIARELGLPHHFRSRRGEVIEQIEQTARNSELLVVSLAPQAVGSRSWWGAAIYELAGSQLPAILFVRDREPAEGRPVLMLADAGEDVHHTFRHARRLARALDSPLTVAVVSDDPETQRQVDSLLVPPEANWTVVGLRERNSSAIADFARSQRAGAVVLTADDPTRDVDQVRELLRTTRCALMLVNPHSAET